MDKRVVFSFALAVALFSGCGGSSGTLDGDDSGGSGGSSSSKVAKTGTGYYIDAAVKGASYKCGSESGVTDENGKFTFEKGKDCTFELAGIKLREVKAENLTDKVKIVEDEPKVAVFLQSIDVDGNATNGIQIEAKVLDVLKEALKDYNSTTTVPTGDKLTNVVNDVKNSVADFKGKVVTKDKAMEHVKKSQEKVIKELIAGKTIYKPDVHDGKASITAFKFNNKMTSIHATAGDHSEDFPIQVEGNGFNYDNYRRYQITSQNSDYIVMDYFETEEKKETFRFYYDRAKAEAYLNSLKNGDGSSAVDMKNLVDFKLPFAWYDIDDIYSHSNGDYTLYYWYDSFENGQYSGGDMKVDLATKQHEKDDDEDVNLVLKDGSWQEAPKSYKLSSDKKILTVDAYDAELVLRKEIDLSNKTKDVNIDGEVANVTFSSGAKELLMSYRFIKDSYHLEEAVETHGNMGNDYGEYYKTLKDFISGQSGDRWFDSEGNNGNRVGIAFEKAYEGELREGASGKLVKIVNRHSSNQKIDGFAGSWKIEKLPNSDILALVLNYNADLVDDEDKDEVEFYTIYDGKVYEGYKMVKSDDFKPFDHKAYNKIALDDVVKGFSDSLDGFISSGKDDGGTQEQNQQEQIKNEDTKNLKALIVGKTYYIAETDVENKHVETLHFNSDGKTVTDNWTDADGSSRESKFNYKISGDTLTISGVNGDGEKFSESLKIVKNDKDYIAISNNGKLYKNYQSAMEEVNGSNSDKTDDSSSGSNDLKALLAGKTFWEVYDTHNDKELNKVVFNADLTTIVIEEVIGDNIGEKETVAITYTNGKINISDGGYTQFKEKTADYIDLADSDGKTTRLYFSRAKAEANVSDGSSL
jgi:hypothetical protein